MKVKMVTVGLINNQNVDWPEGWPLPAKGERVELAEAAVYVRHRIWCPLSFDDHEPYVYIVVGPK